uniref:DNA methyltransferase 1-associated protein 1 n=1 Tax=Acrobeloides nanus TaxID=290746 RepID=A0A914BX92_9BILA
MRDIMGLSQAPKEGETPLSKTSKKSFIKKGETFKRPQGMHRELFNLLVNQGKEMSKSMEQSIVPSDTKTGYRNVKAQIGFRRSRKWQYKPFLNEARNDGLQLKHWEREDRKPTEPYPFARFNKVLPIPKFSDAEYERFIRDPKWSKSETEHLFDLCERFDLRWPVIMDRFDFKTFKSTKTMEDLKERYYDVVNELNAARGNNVEPLSYDVEHEKRRKEQLCKLWNRTKEQIKEEEDLKLAMKKIETKRREREKKVSDLKRILQAADRASNSPSPGGLSPGGSSHKRRGMFKKTGAPGAAQLMTPTEASHGIRFHEFRSSGPHLRSQEIRLPSNVGQKKMKNIDIVVERLKLDVFPHAHEEIVKSYNEFRSDVVVLLELKTALQAAESELEVLRNRMQNELGRTFDIEPRFQVKDNEIGDRPKTRGKGAPTSRRRITQMLEIIPGGLPTTRKRKATERASPAPELKRSSRSTHS